MRIRNLITILSAIILFSTACQQTDPNTNVVIIVADDLGIEEIAYYQQHFNGTAIENQFIETPNLNALAHDGIAFTQAYAYPEGASTRAALLTGKHAASTGIHCSTNKYNYTFHDQRRKIDEYHIHDCVWKEAIKIPYKLKNGLTQTALLAGQDADEGKNEVTFAERMERHKSVFIGKWHLGGHGAKGYQPADQGFEPLAWVDRQTSPYTDFRKQWTTNSSGRNDKVSGSLGLDNDAEYLTDFIGQNAVQFIQTQKNTEKPFTLLVNYFAIGGRLSAPEEELLYFRQKALTQKASEEEIIKASAIKRLDQSIGAIREALVENGMEKNTMILFVSDNGSDLSGQKFKGSKSMLYEGGIRVPFIAYQKGKIKSKKNCNTPITVVDMVPTLLEKCEYDNPTMNMHGQSLLPLFRNIGNKRNSYDINQPKIWHFPFNKNINDPDDGMPLTPRSAIRKGDYKLIVDWTGNMKLYNIANDAAETSNLVASNFDLADSLHSELCAWLRKNVEEKYYPSFNPYYDLTKDKRQYPYPNVLAKLWFGEE